MARRGKEGIKKEILYKYFDEKLTIDEITNVTDLSYKTITKYYTFYMREKRRILAVKEKDLESFEEVITIATNKSTKKNKYCNNHIIKADSMENCKRILLLRERELKEINLKVTRLIKKIINLENENQRLRDENSKLNIKLKNKNDTIKIYY